MQCTPDQLTNELDITDDQQSSQEYSEFVEQLAEFIKDTRDDATKLANALAGQIKRGQIEIETQGREITVRIKERGSFESGSADLQPGFDEVLRLI